MNSARKSYDAQFKLKVIEQAEKTSNRAAERALGVSECMIRKWRSQKEDLKKASKSSKKLPGGGRKAQYNDIEDQIMERIMRERELQHHVPCKLIQQWTKDLAQAEGVPDFRASRGWLANSMKRFNLVLRRKTTTGQRLPRDVVSKVANFVAFCKKQREKWNLNIKCIINMDEIPISADMPSETTVTQKGVTTVPIRTTGHEKNRLTVCLAAKAD